jgi:hypothetical protein
MFQLLETYFEFENILYQKLIIFTFLEFSIQVWLAWFACICWYAVHGQHYSSGVNLWSLQYRSFGNLQVECSERLWVREVIKIFLFQFPMRF